MTRLESLEGRRAAILAVALFASAFLLIYNAKPMSMGLGTPQEMRALDADEGLAVRGIWNVWSQKTLDYQKAIHTGYYYYTATVAGALLVPWLGNHPATLALGARWWSMAQGIALILVGTWMLGRVTEWSWYTAFLPAFLALNPHVHEVSSEVQLDVSMLFWIALATGALSQFLVDPTRKRFRTAAVLAALSFAAKPAVAPFAMFFVAANIYQIWRDDLPWKIESCWRLGKGLQYFLLVYLLASPFTFFSPGLFVASLRSELAATATKFGQRSATDWIHIAGAPTYLGYGWLALGLVVAGAVTIVWTLDRKASDNSRNRELRVFVAVNGLWAISYWAFVFLTSRSFIERYLSPAFMAFLFALVGGLVLLARRGKGWTLAAALGLTVVLVTAVPGNWRLLEKDHRKDLQRDERLAPHRTLDRELRTLLKADDAILADAFVNLDPDYFVNTQRMQRLRKRYFSHQPKYFLTRIEIYSRFSRFQDIADPDNVADRERKLSAVFYREVAESQLFGTLEEVKRWPETGVVLFRFKAPTDEAFAAGLFDRLNKKAQLSPDQ